MTEEISFGDWLRKQRRALDLSRQAFASQVGCAPITLRRIEAGTLKPSTELASLLLEKLGIPQAEQPQWVRFARGLSTIPQISIQEFSLPSTNLPSPLTSFIGREEEQDELIDLLGKNRLVTLAGAGGIGKTRLSFQVGEKLRNNYPSGVWFVTFDSLSDPSLVPQTVASVFDIREAPDRPVIEILKSVLRQKTMLLILDNCDHVLDACAHLIKILLSDCPGLKILSTSREVLNMEGEATYYLPSLAVPENEAAFSQETNEYASVRLFEERAALAFSSFRRTRQNTQIVGRICRRLDGIPLAIELAAARTDILRVNEILEQLNHCFDLLVSNSRTALPRHQTMRASMDWSWGLLSPIEQTFLRQLAVFAGGWTLEASKAVCEGDALNLTSALAKKSLIIVNQGSNHETRYRIHEIVRQYGREKLVQAGEEENIRVRHLKYFLQFSEQAEAALNGPAQIEWYARLNDERDNIRAALEWAQRNDVEAGLYLSGRLRRFWQNFDMREGAHWLAGFLQGSGSKSYPLARAKALCAQAWILFWAQEFDLAPIDAQESLNLYRACSDKIGEIDALFALGLTDFKAPVEKTIEIYNQALLLSKSIGDPWRHAYALAHLGGYKNIPSLLEEAAALFDKIGDLETSSENMLYLMRRNMWDGNLPAAQKWLDKVAKAGHNLNNKMLEAEILHEYGRIALIEGDTKRASANLQGALEIANAVGNQMTSLWTSAHLGYVALHEGNLKEAYDIFARTVREFQKDEAESGVIFSLEGMAGLKVSLDKHRHAACLIGWADMQRQKTNDPRPFIEQAFVDKIIAACLIKMGEAAFSDAYDEGQTMTLDEAVKYALEEG